MSGNVYEWCWDWGDRDDDYPNGTETNPTGAASGSYRVRRGGSLDNTADAVRSACRSYYYPSRQPSDVGFRLVRGYENSFSVKPDGGTEQSGDGSSGGTLSPVAMVWVEGGSFMMGSPTGETGRNPYGTEARHEVTLTTGFYMGTYEVTQKAWVEVMGNNPSSFRGDDLPVEYVSWYEAVEYCNKRSAKEGLAPAYTIDKTNQDTNNTSSYDTEKWTVTLNTNAKGYRLPTEAEWEYAARGGSTWNSPYFVYAGSNTVDEVAWWYNDPYSGRTTHPVGGKKPNSLGLYDMSGNVGEWCWDWYDLYPTGSQTNPTGAASGPDRVIRGGSWYSPELAARSACQSYSYPSDRYDFLGFRLVRPQ